MRPPNVDVMLGQRRSYGSYCSNIELLVPSVIQCYSLVMIVVKLQKVVLISCI